MSRRYPASLLALEDDCAPPRLPLLREPDVSALALWSALLVAGSVLLAALAIESAHAAPAAASAEAKLVAAAAERAEQAQAPPRAAEATQRSPR